METKNKTQRTRAGQLLAGVPQGLGTGATPTVEGSGWSSQTKMAVSEKLVGSIADFAPLFQGKVEPRYENMVLASATAELAAGIVGVLASAGVVTMGVGLAVATAVMLVKYFVAPMLDKCHNASFHPDDNKKYNGYFSNNISYVIAQIAAETPKNGLEDDRLCLKINQVLLLADYYKMIMNLYDPSGYHDCSADNIKDLRNGIAQHYDKIMKKIEDMKTFYDITIEYIPNVPLGKVIQGFEIEYGYQYLAQHTDLNADNNLTATATQTFVSIQRKPEYYDIPIVLVEWTDMRPEVNGLPTTKKKYTSLSPQEKERLRKEGRDQNIKEYGATYTDEVARDQIGSGTTPVDAGTPATPKPVNPVEPPKPQPDTTPVAPKPVNPVEPPQPKPDTTPVAPLPPPTEPETLPDIPQVSTKKAGGGWLWWLVALAGGYWLLAKDKDQDKKKITIKAKKVKL